MNLRPGLAGILMGLASFGIAQELPEPITKENLPPEAVCAKCKSGNESVAAGANWKGKPYYFCNEAELKGFLAKPTSFEDKLKQDNVSPVAVPPCSG